jgi:hypothetical protein
MFPALAYHTDLDELPAPAGLTALAGRVFAQVFRRDFSAPGVALIGLGRAVGSHQLRLFMSALKDELSARAGPLVYRSLARFNQQVTTKYHLDGGPEESYLMLGYEPSAVPSALAVADYTRAAHDCGITPRALLEAHNPMYAHNEQRLLPYVTALTAFDPSRANVLIINNSLLPYAPGGTNPLGVMHQATILAPRPDRSRVVNSSMLVRPGAPDAASEEEVRRFLETDVVDGIQGV